jgi:hypothetical protein
MKEEQQAKQYHSQIESEEEFDDEIEESEEETITLDFDNGVAIQEGIIVGEGLYDKIDEVVKSINEKLDVTEEARQPLVAKAMVQAISGDTETSLINAYSEEQGEKLEKILEAEAKQAESEKVYVAPKPTYKDALTDVFVNAITNNAIKSLIEAHVQLEKDLYDDLSSKHQKKMGKAYAEHQYAMLKSIDKKRGELRRSYGYTGRVSFEHIPDWSKPYVEDYIKNFVNELCDFIGDAE